MYMSLTLLIMLLKRKCVCIRCFVARVRREAAETVKEEEGESEEKRQGQHEKKDRLDATL